MRANAARPIRMEDIAAAAGCSVQNSRVACAKESATPPNAGFEEISTHHCQNPILLFKSAIHASVASETVSTALRISWGRGASDLLPAQQGADPRQQLPKVERSSGVFVLFEPSAPSKGIYG